MKSFRNILRAAGTIAFICYILFLIGEGLNPLSESSFEVVSVFLLFLVFMAGYYLLWKNELVAGIMLIVWHGIQWCLVLWVWVDGGMTLILGFPIFLLGIFAMIYGIRKKSPGPE